MSFQQSAFIIFVLLTGATFTLGHNRHFSQQPNALPTYPNYEVDGSYVLPLEYENEDGYGEDLGSYLAQRSAGVRLPTFQSLCPSIMTPVYLNISIYRQFRYDEITCLHAYDGRPDAFAGKHNKVCGGAGFQCIQRNRTILLLKRTDDQNCYETESRTINSGCECVWPKHTLGDIADYHG